MSEIKPALSPEQWQSGYIREPLSIEGIHRDDGRMWIYLLDEGPEGSDASVELTLEDRTAIAAFALHDQSFGFTWEDVRFLRVVAADAANLVRHDQGFRNNFNRANSLADRIAALLPPREET